MFIEKLRTKTHVLLTKFFKTYLFAVRNEMFKGSPSCQMCVTFDASKE